MFDLRRYGESTALVEGDLRLSYGDLADTAESIAAACAPRSLVFALCSNTVASVAAYVGFLERGVVALLLDASIDQALLDALVDEYRPRYLWAPETRLESLGDVRPSLEFGGYGLVELAGEGQATLHDELALLISTSGSTGSPKLVRQTDKNLVENARSIISYLSIGSEDVAITTMPMNYVFGLSIINTHLMQGAKVVLTELNCYAKRFWELAREEGVTSFSGVPFMYEMLDRLHFCSKPRPRSLRAMTQAGGKLDPALQERFATWAAREGVDFVIMYGASEATARMAYLPPDKAQEKRGSIGVPIPGGRFELVDEGGGRIERPHVAGELVYYGPNVTMGYATTRDDLARGDERRGRLSTGDIAEVDEDGYYYVVGRRSRFVKIMGKRLGLDEVERLVTHRFGLFGVACVGNDRRLVVCVPSPADGGAIVSYLHEVTGVNASLIEVQDGIDIPKTSSNKTGYAELARIVGVGSV